MKSSSLLEINNLTVAFSTAEGALRAVKGVSMTLRDGETLALVGESGCGKTVLCKSMLKILCNRGKIESGEIVLGGENLVTLDEAAMVEHRGRDIAMVFQDPMTSLDPAFCVGEQITETILAHENISRREAKRRAVEMMELVGIDEVQERYFHRPFQFSGGMRQRIAIAIALSSGPRLLLADEPTTALDEKTRVEIISLIKEIQKKLRIAMLFITHDLSIVEKVADRVAIMKDGSVVEEGAVSEIFSQPKHEYTKKLLGYLDYSRGRGHNHRGIIREDGRKLITIKNLNVKYKLSKGALNHVLKDFNLDIYEGEIVGVVGRSGCGKSTLARCIMSLEKYDGIISKEEGINVQMIFQDTGNVFNDRMSVEQIIAEPLVIAGKRENLSEKVAKCIESVELDRTFLKRKHYELSGGQRQRIAIARALITEPDVIIADEPLTGLDVTAQAQIVHLLKKHSEQKGMSIVFIAHDLPMVNHISDRICDMDSLGN